MTESHVSDIPMTPYILIVAASKILVGGSAFLLSQFLGWNIGPANSGIAIATIFVGAGWFAHRANRPMTKRERLRFAAGVTLVDAILSIAIVLMLAWLAGLPLTSEQIALAFSHGTSHTIDWGLYAVLFIGSAIVFAAAYYIGWATTRKLPKKGGTDRRSDAV